jgi:cation-transporting ATPase 13A3/4/5
MENKLKDATVGVISNLRDCKVRVVMATGDNVLTAVSVARKCNIIDIEKECFLADINDQNQVFWKSTDPSRKIEPGVLPLDYHDETIEVACSGKAFKHFIANQT